MASRRRVPARLAIPAAAAAVCSPLGAGGTRAQESFPAGEVVEHVQAASDPTQSYALYLPSAYDPARRWPVLFLMDPRGRALVPLRLFLPAAEELGYVVMSSYDTMSDGPREPNEIAMQAMLSDAFDRLAVDSRRLYLVGFSGTAREAWDFASRIPENVAGVIGFGAGMPGSWMDRALVLSGAGVSYFGGAGTTDFNFEELRELDRMLEKADIPYRTEFFAGAHQWAPEGLCRKAVDWMELQAIKAGLRPEDEAWVSDLYAAFFEEAEALEESGHLYAAAEAYRFLAADFSGLIDVTRAEARKNALQRDGRVEETRATLSEIADLRREFDDELMAVSGRLEWDQEPPSLEEARNRLDLTELAEEASSAVDTLQAQGAQRRLENAFVQFSFYLPRNTLERNSPERALASLEIAEEIKPGSPRICWFRARALAQADQIDEAIDQVTCLVEAGLADPSPLEEDPYLEPLRDHPRYRELIGRMRSSTAPPAESTGRSP